nr:MAG TPA: hypothetical protein [Caudoviricetes sp.]
MKVNPIYLQHIYLIHFQADTLFQFKKLNLLFNSIFKTIFDIVFILKNTIYLILVRGIKTKLTSILFLRRCRSTLIYCRNTYIYLYLIIVLINQLSIKHWLKL